MRRAIPLAVVLAIAAVTYSLLRTTPLALEEVRENHSVPVRDAVGSGRSTSSLVEELTTRRSPSHLNSEVLDGSEETETATEGALLRCQILDSRRRGLSGLKLFLIPDSTRELPDPGPELAIDELLLAVQVSMARTDAEGFAELRAPSSGQFLVVLRSRGWEPFRRTLTLRAGDSIDLEHTAEEAMRITGQVVDDLTGSPVVDARITFVPIGRGESWESDFLHRLDYLFATETSISGPNGDFEMSALGGELSTLRVDAESYPVQSVFGPVDDEHVVIRLGQKGHLLGIVSDDDGNPLPEVNVMFTSRGREPAFEGRAPTNEHGTFRLEGIPLGLNRIQVGGPGYATVVEGVDILPGESKFLKFELPPEALFRGRVVDDRGEPVSEVSVSVFDEDLRTLIGVMESEPDGSWFMHWVPEGHRLTVEGIKDGYALAEMPGILAPNEDIVVVMRRRGSLRGRVVDTDGHPVPRFSIQNVPSGFPVAWEYTTRVELDKWEEFQSAEGAFQMFDVWPGSNELRFVAPGFLAKTLRDVSIPMGGAADDLEVVLSRGESIWGRVLHESGEPISGAIISIPGTSFGGHAVAGRVYAPATTDGQGQFQLTGVSTSGFSLLIDTPSNGRIFLENLDVREFPREIVVAATGSIAGQVSVPWSRPDTVCFVSATIPGTWIQTTVTPDVDGAFLIDGLAPGSYVVEFLDQWGAWEHEEYGCQTKMVRVASGQVSRVDFSTQTEGVVGGRLLGSQAGRVNYEAVLFQKAGGKTLEQFARSPLNDNGRFSFFGVPMGDYVVRVTSGQRGTLLALEQEVSIREEEPVRTLEFRVPGGALRGVVFDDEDSPASNALVSLLSMVNGEVRCGSRVSAEGEYRLSTVPDGKYLLHVASQGFAEDYYEVVEIPYQDHLPRIEHWLEPESRLIVTAVDDRGLPIADAQVTLSISDRPRILPALQSSTDAFGNARFVQLPSGRTLLSCHKAGHLPIDGESLALVTGGTLEYRVTLTRLASLRVSVMTREGVARSGQIIFLRSLDDSTDGPWQGSSDRQGEVTFYELAPGEYQAWTEDMVPLTVRVDPGRQTSVTVVVEDGVPAE